MNSTSITQLLDDVRSGANGAEAKLFDVVYEGLRDLAAAKMRRQRPDHTLQPTALVNEMAVKLLKGDRPLERARNRAEFFGLAARTMRSVLVDHARRRNAQHRPTGDGRQQVDVTNDGMLDAFEQSEGIDILVFDEALQYLRKRSQRQHDIVMLHFFGGLPLREIANHLSVSVSTVEKDWRFARIWLRRQLG